VDVAKIEYGPLSPEGWVERISEASGHKATKTLLGWALEGRDLANLDGAVSPIIAIDCLAAHLKGAARGVRKHPQDTAPLSAASWRALWSSVASLLAISKMGESAIEAVVALNWIYSLDETCFEESLVDFVIDVGVHMQLRVSLASLDGHQLDLASLGPRVIRGGYVVGARAWLGRVATTAIEPGSRTHIGKGQFGLDKKPSEHSTDAVIALTALVEEEYYRRSLNDRKQTETERAEAPAGEHDVVALMLKEIKGGRIQHSLLRWLIEEHYNSPVLNIRQAAIAFGASTRTVRRSRKAYEEAADAVRSGHPAVRVRSFHELFESMKPND